MKRFLVFAFFINLLVARGEIRFVVPSDFQIERAVEPGAVRFPMFADFDDKGRLFVTESSGLDLYEELQKQTRKCRVSMLMDGNGDGKFEKQQVFAEELVFPMGLAWRDGKLYVADPPDLVALEDTNGDGRADKRTVILTGFGHTDNGSLHGLIFGPDGLLYMTMGGPDGYRLKQNDGSFVEGKNGALIRCKPDGSDVEILCRGFENLVEIAFLPSGEIVGTVNWLSLPREGVRDALVHLVPGGVYPLNAHASAETPHFFSGELLPPMTWYPAVALSGLMRYGGTKFPGKMQGSLFSAQFNTRKIARHQVVRKGRTLETIDEDFVSTDDPDFHPSDVLEAADGSIIVVDTGSWYTHHCPTGRIRKVPAEGGIFRVSYKGVSDSKAPPPLEKLPATPRTVNKLVAELAKGDDDVFLRHELLFKLHQLTDKQTLLKLVEDESPPVRRSALIILDQAPHNALTVEMALSCLTNKDASVRQAAMDAFGKHSEWSSKAVARAKQALATDPVIPEAADLAALTHSDFEIRKLVAEGIGNNARPVESRVVLIETAAKWTPKVINGEERLWADAFAPALRSANLRIVEAALKSPQVPYVGTFHDELTAIATNTALPDAIRLDGLRLYRGTGRFENSACFDFVVSRLGPTNRATIRFAAAELATAAKLSPQQAAKIVRTVEGDLLVGPTIANALAKNSEVDAETRKLIEKIQGRTKAAIGDLPGLLSKYESHLTGGDENRGQQLFLGKAGCAACHRVGKHGGVIGPDLTRIGTIRSGRDLIESLVAPSATLAQGYEMYRVHFTSGATAEGMRVRQLDDRLVLRDAAGNERDLAPNYIERMERLEVSVMPEGLLTGLAEDEIRDLLAYLQRLK